MSKSDDHFEDFGDHTLLKHRILDAYLKAWAFKLLNRAAADDRVFYVDCFAGEGQDQHGNPGSPTIACRAAIQVQSRQVSAGHSGQTMSIVAIEAKRARFRRLEAYLRPFRESAGVDVTALQGEAADHISSLAARIGRCPTLYFLDPFGVGGLDASCYPVMLAGPRNEVFALFHDMGALRLRGILHATTDYGEQIQAIREQPSLFGDEQQQIDQIIDEEARRQEHISRTEPAARRNISRALGSDSWIEDLAELPNDQAREQLVLRFIKALLDAGGQHAVVLPMHDSTGQHKYLLVHVSKSPAGTVAMKEAISEGLKDTTLADEMRATMKAALRVPIERVFALLGQRFGGRTVRWTRDREEESLQWWLLTRADVFSFQLPEIRQALKAAGWKTSVARKEYYVIPKL